MAIDEPFGHIADVADIQKHEDGSDDDALDAALDMELAATYLKWPLPSQAEAEPAKLLSEKIATAGHQETSTSSSSQLSFAFPGWEVDMAKDAKREKMTPPTSRHIDGPQSIAPNKKGKRVMRPRPERASSLPLEDVNTPVKGCPVDQMDDELLACVFMRLNVKDLCASMRTCKRWHRVACQEDVWEHIPLPINVPGALPRWMEIRNAGTAMDLRDRLHVFRRGYEFMQAALNAWWDRGKPDLRDGKHPSAIFRSVAQKLVINDWSLLYEALGAAFSDRADRIAVPVLAAVQRVELSRLSSIPSGDANVVIDGREGVEFGDAFEVQEIWGLVLSMWRRYTRWLTLVVSHCPALNHEVLAERARSNALAMTPTLYGKGIICFRSQVILKYGIRSVLQANWSGLASAKWSGIASDDQLALFRSVDHLLQETSLLDDLTLPPSTFTQQKLRCCFGNETSGKALPRGKPTPTALT